MTFWYGTALAPTRAGTWDLGAAVVPDWLSCLLLCPSWGTALFFTLPWGGCCYQSMTVLSETLYSGKRLPFSPPTSEKPKGCTSHFRTFEPRPRCWLIKPWILEKQTFGVSKHYPAFQVVNEAWGGCLVFSRLYSRAHSRLLPQTQSLWYCFICLRMRLNALFHATKPSL